METIRCFIAIELSREIKQALGEIERELQKSISGVKWVDPENIHLTLKFLGNIQKGTVEDIKHILEQAVSGTPPFKIRLSEAGAFPGISRPRVLWVGIDEGKHESAEIAGRIDDGVSRLGVEKESRPFHPHLTLARVKFIKDKDSVRNAFSSLRIPPSLMTADSLTLFQSTLTREGPVYTPLYSAGM